MLAVTAPSKLVLRLFTKAKLVERLNVDILLAVVYCVLIVITDMFEALMPPPI